MCRSMADICSMAAEIRRGKKRRRRKKKERNYRMKILWSALLHRVTIIIIIIIIRKFITRTCSQALSMNRKRGTCENSLKTRSTETVHTSAKARVLWPTVVGRWHNDISCYCDACYCMPCTAVSCSAVGWCHFPYLPVVMNPENNPCIQTVIWIAIKI